MLVEFLKNTYKKLNNRLVHNAENKKMSIEDQKTYLHKFSEPEDDYERSFYKYKCFTAYCYFRRKWLIVIYNIGAMFLSPIMFARLKKKGIGKVKAEQSFDGVIENVPRLRNYDVIPEEILSSVDRVKEIEELDYIKAYLSSTAIDICKELRKRYFWHFYFRLIVMIKLGLFNHYIQDYNPKKIVFYSCEREFSGPLQTLLCESEGVKYISFMHGDYLYALCFAFQKYSHYYTWDEAYNQMFLNLRCEFPMTVYQPKKLSGIAECLDEKECEYFATYYFSAETRECAEKVYTAFSEFEKKGLRCKIRPHPRFSDIKMLEDVFLGIKIENTGDYSLASSVTDTLYTVGLNTTVLSQAYFSGKKVAIDDISMYEQYLELQEKGYIMLNRDHILFSDIIKQVEHNNPYDSSYKFYKRNA